MSTKLSQVLMIMSCVFVLAGCQTTASNCAGWTPPPKINDPVRLVKTERPLSEWVASTKEFGQRQKCWR
ncbi:MAG: hypothetical protein E6Q97_32405 [Desulfurellales bacterium]|nr:MAG: hypothetical protein E6Q97_32405 [Desulfurellales bacterium]